MSRKQIQKEIDSLKLVLNSNAPADEKSFAQKEIASLEDKLESAPADLPKGEKKKMSESKKIKSAKAEANFYKRYKGNKEKLQGIMAKLDEQYKDDKGKPWIKIKREALEQLIADCEGGENRVETSLASCEEKVRAHKKATRKTPVKHTSATRLAEKLEEIANIIISKNPDDPALLEKLKKYLRGVEIHLRVNFLGLKRESSATEAEKKIEQKIETAEAA